MFDLDRRLTPELAERLARILKFAMTGGLGFVVDVGILSVLTVVFDVNPYGARVVAILVAMTTTWLVNRRFTFKVADRVSDARAVAAEGGRYGLVAVAAALVNYAVYAVTLWSLPVEIFGTDDFSPPLAAVVGSGVAMFVSYFGYSRFAFRIHLVAHRDAA
jgi:putative flippase GtrA